jgi:glycosyltransferase involved in cell wall biosynthesis
MSLAKTSRDYPSVLFLALDTFSILGGIQAFNQRLISNLATLALERGGEKPVILCMGDQESDFPRGVRTEFKGYGRGRLNFIIEALKQSKRAEVLLVGHINLVPVAWLAMRLRPELRTILFVHGDEVWNSHLRKMRWYERYILRCIDRFASVSRFTADVMRREYKLPLAKFTIFPNAVDDFSDVHSAIDREPNLILTVCRLGIGDRMKNVDVLIKAVALLIKDGHNVRLEIVGDGPLRPELENLCARLGVESWVSFLGRIDKNALADAYARASVFALPSSKEGFGIVYLEAWLHELPVICGTLGASHEVVTDGVDGFVVDEANAVDVAEKILTLINEPEVAQAMGRRGHEKVRNTYLNIHSRTRLLELLTDVVSQ